MESLYEWLYDTYAQPKLAKQPLFQDKLLAPLLETLPRDQQISCLDLLHTLQLHWCTAAFTVGVQAGLHLAAEQE